MINKSITLVTVCDNHYLILLAALLKSIQVNHHTEERITVYIVEDGVTQKNKARLEGSLDLALIDIIWIKMEAAIPEGTTLPLDKSTYPLNIYLRLFIPSFVPSNLKRILYLDVDMLALTDISNLWNIDLEGKVLGAVTDPIGTLGNKWGGIANYKELGISGDAKYFNTGMLLIDLDKWKEYNVTEKVLSCVKENKEFANFPDQYGLNIILFENWKELDMLWNCFSSLNIEDPYIIHFNHRKPIYKSYNKNERHRNFFYEYLNMTKWAGTQPIGEFRRYLKKVYNIVEKVLKIPFTSLRDRFSMAKYNK